MTKTYSIKKLPNKSDRHKLFGSVEPTLKTKPTEKEDMADLQNQKKDFLFALDAVGIANVKHPIIVESHIKPYKQTTIGNFKFTSSLSQTSKGTNMSRFTEQLNTYYQEGFVVNFESLKKFTKELSERLDQKDATIEVSFPWFFERKAPQTGQSGLNHADVSMSVTYDRESGFHINASLGGKITTLCPCSKEISEYSAHNQRGTITMEIGFTEDFNDKETDWKLHLLEAAESNASSRLYPVLKRPDEKMVTEHAYENPRFVEDMVRLVAADLYELDFVSKFKVTCRNEESIHLHDAIASVTFDKFTEVM
ncbi:GTP cyclohydrolase FolE2 [Oceanobacillus luteolus]|uniref:GTP cyclohydrolase FolE2 n=1 Tax=Oceanobacillus luteolus TaxID=1274358 RepID=A0ABW4HT16_9BACI|nr:GTP cyclohydrolase FolE2 [Oceanobacillus luteolus]MCM3738945.1 GTP cyclohydrolase FolE2 [Oceanobacillus luteolus]